MNDKSLLLAKIAALKKSFENIEYSNGQSRCLGTSLEPLLPRYESLVSQIKIEFDKVYDDLPQLSLPITIGSSNNGRLYQKSDVKPLINNLDYILEVYSNMRIGENYENKDKSHRIFISHGRSEQWRNLQAYIEKDLEYNTLELAQQANLGRTIL